MSLYTPKLLVLTPTYDGKVYMRFMQSYMHTEAFLRALGVRCELASRDFDSLVPRARIALLGMFYGSDATHALFVDGDIDWHPSSVLSLLQSQKDVVCGVYPKKNYPLEFPANFAPGTHENLPYDSQSGCFELQDAPTGFLMISREAVRQMIESYPERRCMIVEGGWDAPANQHTYDFFPCPVTNGMYQSEDYGFCQLWRSIGGKVWVQPDITLGHSGHHRFVGCLADYITAHD